MEFAGAMLLSITRSLSQARYPPVIGSIRSDWTAPARLRAVETDLRGFPSPIPYSPESLARRQAHLRPSPKTPGKHSQTTDNNRKQLVAELIEPPKDQHKHWIKSRNR